MSPTVITADEVAQLLGLGVKAVYAGAKAGEIPCRRVGRRFVFCRETLATWVRCETTHNPDALKNSEPLR